MTKDSSRANSVLWTEVEPGHTIDSFLAGATPFGGVVETRTEDGKIIWLNGASAERRLFPADEGYIPLLREGITR
jgi:hypothetical protein